MLRIPQNFEFEILLNSNQFPWILTEFWRTSSPNEIRTVRLDRSPTVPCNLGRHATPLDASAYHLPAVEDFPANNWLSDEVREARIPVELVPGGSVFLGILGPGPRMIRRGRTQLEDVQKKPRASERYLFFFSLLPLFSGWMLELALKELRLKDQDRSVLKS